MTMMYPLLGMLVGALLGALGGPLVATLGAVLGVVAGMMFGNLLSNVRRPRSGSRQAPDARRILCVPKGQVATTTFVRDAASGAWLDVASCSLCSPEDEVMCQKNCLVLVRDSLPRTTPIVPAPVGSAT